jgi:hypothetical protein
MSDVRCPAFAEPPSFGFGVTRRRGKRPTPEAFARHGGQGEQALNAQRRTPNSQLLGTP